MSKLKPAFVIYSSEGEAKAKAAALRTLAAEQGALVAIDVAPERAKRR